MSPREGPFLDDSTVRDAVICQWIWRRVSLYFDSFWWPRNLACECI